MTLTPPVSTKDLVAEVTIFEQQISWGQTVGASKWATFFAKSTSPNTVLQYHTFVERLNEAHVSVINTTSGYASLNVTYNVGFYKPATFVVGPLSPGESLLMRGHAFSVANPNNSPAIFTVDTYNILVKWYEN